MATIAELNIRLGLLTKEFERQLKGVERRLQQSGQRLSALGSDLTAAVSLPLAALGGFAIKSAGDIEALRLALVSTMADAGRSTEEATRELEELRKSALAPGLDFEQAVKGSIRLQNVGFAAEEARAILEQLANAVALTGGSAQELDGVTRQFAQMISKGRILQEDLTIIQENMPAISKAMEQAFGTRSAERLRELGVSAEDFIKGVTQQFAQLPRVSGGIKNSLVNLFVGLKLEAARLGEEINKAFNIGDAAEGILKAVRSVVDAFAGLSDGTKRFIVQAGLIAVALGPAIKAFGVLQSTAGAAVGGYRVMLGVLENVGTRLKVVTAAFNALNFATRAFVLVGLVTAIGALAYNLGLFNKELTATEKAQRSVNQIIKEASESIAGEKVRASELIGVLKDQNATRDDQKKALNALKAISPEHFRNIDLEKSKVGDLDKALDSYIDSLLRAAKARAAFARIEEIEKLRQKLIETAEPSIWESLKNRVISAGNGIAYAGLQANTQAANFVKLRDELNKEEDALRDVIKANGDFVSTVSGVNDGAAKTGAAFKASAEGAKTAKEKADLYAKALASIAAVSQKGDVLGAEVMGEQAREIENQIERLLENGFKPYGKEIQNLLGMLKTLRADLGKGFDTPNLTQQEVGFSVNVPQLPSLSIPDQVVSIDTTAAQAALEGLSDTALKGIESAGQFKSVWEQIGEIMAGLGEGIDGFAQGLSSALDLANSRGEVLNSVMLSVADAVSAAAASGATSFGQLAQAAVQAAAKIVRTWIQQGVAAAVAKALSQLPFPVNLAAGAAAGAIAAGLFNKAISAIGVPALAKGGVIDEPTYALIGEYPGAKSNPEIVTPENKMRDVFSEVLRSFSFNMPTANMSFQAPAAQSFDMGRAGFFERLLQQNFQPNPVAVDVNVTGQIGHDAIYLSNQKEADRRRRFG